MLYPLKFHSIKKDKLWGTEFWTIASLGDEDSIVNNGYLEGNSLSDLLETYMDELVGENIYQMYGNYFPLLFKIIDAHDSLSVQVHPDDMAAAEWEQMGKTKMWYVSNAQENSSIVSGFNQDVDAHQVLQALEEDTIFDLLNECSVKRGDVIYLPAGRVHALSSNIKVVEVQENSDITYRLYDYNRVDKNGQLRDLHIEQALDVIDYTRTDDPLVTYEAQINNANVLVQDEHFCANVLCLDKTIERDYARLDSFVVYICLEGTCEIASNEATEVLGEMGKVTLAKGDSVLIPASLNDIVLSANHSNVRLLEVYIV